MTNKEEQTILLIEDNAGDIRLIKEMLKEITSINYKLISAETLKDGCGQFNNHHFILVLLDLNLPDSNGKQTFDTLMKFAGSIPVVLVSGLQDEELSLSLIKEGAQDYILKRELNSIILGKTIQYALIRKKAEEELKASKDFLDKIINSVASPIFVKDDQHKFCLVNDALCSLLKLPVEKLIGTTGYEYFPEEQMKEFLAKDIEVLNTGNENINEEVLTDGTGKIQNIVTKKTLYTDANGKKYLVGVINDITENRKKENDLIISEKHAQESDRLKSAFLANMSHEIRTPMNGILGFSALLKEPDLSGEEQQNYINIIEKSGIRMLNIINDIIDISKIESGLMEVNGTSTNINDQMDYVYTFFKPETEKKKLQLVLKKHLPLAEAIITNDREKIYAILINLVKNAIKYTNDGVIEIGCDKKGDILEFYVKDTGIGIPANRQVAVFERFIQADIADIHAFQGAGLGLSIAKAYTELLGGHIWMESEEGKGSIFFFSIPHTPISKDNIAELKPVADTETKNTLGKLKIVIAEDDETSEMLVAIAMKPYSKEIIKVHTGAAAVEICRKNQDIDLVLMDIQMPVLNGYEATRQIRKFNKNVVIVAQTAFGLSGDREKAIEAGCNDYIAKPINKYELIAIIEKQINKDAN
jgi:PAS domain S-box-containing protein